MLRKFFPSCKNTLHKKKKKKISKSSILVEDPCSEEPVFRRTDVSCQSVEHCEPGRASRQGQETQLR